MRSVFRLPIQLALALVLVFVALGSARAQAPNAVADLWTRVNRERITRNLPPLALNAQLTLAAQNHASEIARTGNYGHIGADGSMASDRAARAGYGAYSWGRRIGENWAHYFDAPTALGMWMESAPHRANILHALYREIGIGIAPSQNGLTIFVLVFGAQPNVLPVFINDGALATNDANVHLTLTSEDVASAGDGTNGIGKPTHIQISNASDFSGATWQTFSSRINWTLETGNGTRIVYVKYRDAKNRTATASASIALGATVSTPLHAPVIQVEATRPRELTATATRTFTPRATFTPPSTATATLEPTETPTPTMTPSATATSAPTATPTRAVIQSRATDLPDPFALGAFGIGVMLSVFALVKHWAEK
jgi:hypothetical protein